MTNSNPTNPPSPAVPSEWQSIPLQIVQSLPVVVSSCPLPVPRPPATASIRRTQAARALRQFQLSKHQTTHTANITGTTATRDAGSFHAGDGRRRSTQRDLERGVPGRSTACLRRRSHLVPPTPSPTRRRRRTPQRPVCLDVQGPISSAVSAAAPIRPHGALRRKGGGAARRCQAQASIEKRVAAAPKSRPSYHRPHPDLQQVPTCPPTNPPPDSDSPLSAARVTLRAPATPSPSRYQLLLIRPAYLHRRTETPQRTGALAHWPPRLKTPGQYETSRCRCVSASSAGGGGPLDRGGSPSHIAEAHSFRASEPGARAHTRPVRRHPRRRRAVPTLNTCLLTLPMRACLATRFPA